MRFIYSIVTLLAVLSAEFSVAQIECGTVPTQEQLDYMELIHADKSESGNARTATTIVKIPIKFHSVRTSSGSGGLTTTQAASLISRSNSYYIEAGIEFFQFGDINYVNSDEFWNMNSANEGGLAVPNDVPGVINIYFTNTLTSGGLALCGYTRFPPSSDRVFVTYSCALSGTTYEHELGHYFTLFHTHGKTNTGTTDELVNGSNCPNAGDNICDTPADPNLTGKVSGCTYVGTNVDANGQSFNPQVANIMSYAPSGCKNLFTPGQYERIRNGYENGRAYLLVETEGFAAGIFTSTRKTCKGGGIDFIATGSGATSWQWEFPGGNPVSSTLKNPRVTYNSSGTFNVKLTARAGSGQVVVVERTAFITIEDPLDFAVTGIRTYTFDTEISGEFTLVNPDLGTTFSYSPIDRNENANSGSVTVNNYKYLTEQPINYDLLNSPFLNNVGVRQYNVSFDLSYAPRSGGVFGDLIITDRYDSLSLSFYGRCGVKPAQIWKEGGSVLQTVAPMPDEFFPTSSQWKRVEIIVPITTEEFGQFIWTNSSLNGNNIYLDNISIIPDYSLSAPTSFRVTRTVPGDVLLRWLDQSVNELSFVIERSENGGPFSEYEVLPPNTISYLDVNTVVGNSYVYQLYARGFGDNVSATVGPVAVDLVVSIEAPSIMASTQVYPNPFTNILTVEVPETLSQVYVEVYDVNGRLVNLIFNEVSNQAYQANTSDLPYGFYIVKVKGNASQVVFRLIK